MPAGESLFEGQGPMRRFRGDLGGSRPEAGTASPAVALLRRSSNKCCVRYRGGPVHGPASRASDGPPKASGGAVSQSCAHIPHPAKCPLCYNSPLVFPASRLRSPMTGRKLDLGALKALEHQEEKSRYLFPLVNPSIFSPDQL